LVERLENEADLDEFEREEREILQQIEEERHQKPSDDDLEVIGLDEDFNRAAHNNYPVEHSINEPSEQPLEVIDEEQEPKSGKHFFVLNSNQPFKDSGKESPKDAAFIGVPDSVQNRQLSSVSI
jgi:hypothetical protein